MRMCTHLCAWQCLRPTTPPSTAIVHCWTWLSKHLTIALRVGTMRNACQRDLLLGAVHALKRFWCNRCCVFLAHFHIDLLQCKPPCAPTTLPTAREFCAPVICVQLGPKCQRHGLRTPIPTAKRWLAFRTCRSNWAVGSTYAMFRASRRLSCNRPSYPVWALHDWQCHLDSLCHQSGGSAGCVLCARVSRLSSAHHYYAHKDSKWGCRVPALLYTSNT